MEGVEGTTAVAGRSEKLKRLRMFRNTFVASVMLVLPAVVKAQPIVKTIKVNDYEVSLKGNVDGFSADLQSVKGMEGVQYITMRLNTPSPKKPSPLTLQFSHPSLGVHALWHPGVDYKKIPFVRWEFANGHYSSATVNAPVLALYNGDGSNRLTFAVSDALNPVVLRSYINEYTASFDCKVELFTKPTKAFSSYEITLMLDTRKVPIQTTVDDVQKWWVGKNKITVNETPNAAKLPFYSTWYSFHYDVNEQNIEQQCKLARALGCDGIIVDDGWQIEHASEWYAYNGDWKPSATRFKDFKGHVRKVHDMGMKYMIWISVPFVGKKSEVAKIFDGKFLHYIDWASAYVIDPRFPEIREYLIKKYESLVRDYDLDGLKLDFVDEFVIKDTAKMEFGNGRDFYSVEEAADKLLTDIMVRLKAIKPDIMIEFRQKYMGPYMRKYGNMLRSIDCPNSALENRMRTTDLRLTSGNTAIHSDMLLWHTSDSVQHAALQVMNVFFSVPQVSVLLDQVPESHRSMLKYLLGVWKQNRSTLLDGRFKAHHPEYNYPVLEAYDANTKIVGVYADNMVVNISNDHKKILVLNANHGGKVVLHSVKDLGKKSVTVTDCRGNKKMEKTMSIKVGYTEISVPASGLLQVSD